MPLELSRTRKNEMEGLTELQAWMGVNGMCNSTSGLAFGPNAKDPLGGKRDFRADFTFRNESEGPEGAWQQWCMFAFALEAPPEGADLSGGWKVRMKVKADRERSLRVNLDSPRYVMDNTLNGVLYGWEAAAGPETRTLEFALDQASYPGWARVRPDVKLADVVRGVMGISLNPQAAGRTGQGLLTAGTEDAGFLQVDDIEFIRP